MPSSQDLQARKMALEKKLATTPDRNPNGTWNTKHFILRNKIVKLRAMISNANHFENLAR